MSKIYEFGKIAALRELGLEKQALGLPGLTGRMALMGGAGGALLGGAAGAINGGEGGRMQGFARGALTGGALGAGAGALGGRLGNGALNAAGELPNTAKMLAHGSNAALGAGALGALGGGYMAGGTAQQSMLDKLKGYIPGMG